MNKIATTLLLVFLFLSVSAHRNAVGSISIQVTDIKSDMGSVKLSLYNNKDGFPTDATKAFKTAILPIQEGKASLVLTNISFGTYAIALLHDENNNNKMDLHFYGKPSEGYGASNNATGTFGPPSFEDASFVVNKVTTEVTIKMKY